MTVLFCTTFFYEEWVKNLSSTRSTVVKLITISLFAKGQHIFNWFVFVFDSGHANMGLQIG